MSPSLYVDTSVLVPVARNETYTGWATGRLSGQSLISSAITEVELARFAHRVDVDDAKVEEICANLTTLAVSDGVIQAAKVVSGRLKSLDAIHLGTWVQARAFGLDCDFVTADRCLAAAAQGIGARVIHPFDNL